MSESRVRRFEMGASAQGGDRFLINCGWAVIPCGTFYRVHKVGAKGRPHVMSRSAVVDLIDQERLALGLEPIVKRGGL